MPGRTDPLPPWLQVQAQCAPAVQSWGIHALDFLADLARITEKQPPHHREFTVYPLPEPFALREAVPADREFLFGLYGTTRDDLHQAVPDAALLQQLLAMQYQAQEAGYRQGFPEARQWLVLKAGHPVGRVVVDIAPAGLRVVDIAVLPQTRRSGAATAVLAALQAQAQAQQLPLHLAVHHTNTAARRLYEKLGFTATSQDELMAQMTWLGTPA